MGGFRAESGSRLATHKKAREERDKRAARVMAFKEDREDKREQRAAYTLHPDPLVDQAMKELRDEDRLRKK